MKLLKQLRFVLGGIAACIAVFLIEFFVFEISGAMPFGRLINYFFPCIEPTSDIVSSSSLPCYVIYDLGLVYILAFIAFVLMVIAFVRIIKYFVDKR